MKKIILAGLVCLGPAAAMAGDTGFYFDLSAGLSKMHGIGKSDFDAYVLDSGFTIDSSEFDENGSFWSATVGYKPIRYVAGELSYIDLGAAKYRSDIANGGTLYRYKVDLSSGGPALAAVGILPLGKWFEVRGRGGVLFAKTAVDEYLADSSANISAYDSGRSTSLFVGVEGAYKPTKNFSIHAGFHRFSNVGNDEVTGKFDFDALNFGITFHQ